MTNVPGREYVRVERGEEFASGRRLVYDLFFKLGGLVSDPLMEGTILSDTGLASLELAVDSGVVYYRVDH